MKRKCNGIFATHKSLYLLRNQPKIKLTDFELGLIIGYGVTFSLEMAKKVFNLLKSMEESKNDK